MGLSAGLLEVGTSVLCRAIDPTDRLYLMSRHFVWLMPLANLLLFFGLGLFLAGLTKLRPRLGGWLSLGCLVRWRFSRCCWWPAGGFSRGLVHGRVGNFIALGSVARVATGRVRSLVRTLPRSCWDSSCCWRVRYSVETGSKQRREPPGLAARGSPNVLFIVLDTVRADHLSLYGYPRPTTPTLERLAKNGIRFDRPARPPRGRSLARQLLHGPLAP